MKKLGLCLLVLALPFSQIVGARYFNSDPFTGDYECKFDNRPDVSVYFKIEVLGQTSGEPAELNVMISDKPITPDGPFHTRYVTSRAHFRAPLNDPRGKLRETDMLDLDVIKFTVPSIGRIDVVLCSELEMIRYRESAQFCGKILQVISPYPQAIGYCNRTITKSKPKA